MLIHYNIFYAQSFVAVSGGITLSTRDYLGNISLNGAKLTWPRNHALKIIWL